MKRLLCILAAMLMIVSVLSGCTSDKKNQSSAAPTEGDSKGVLTPVGNGEHLEFNLMTWSNRPIWPKFDNNTMLKGIEEKFNVKLNVQVVTTNYNEKINMMTVGDELPDAWVSTLLWDTEKKMANDGYMLCLDDYMDKLSNWTEVRGQGQLDELKIGGKLYCLPTVDTPNQCGPMIRKDWLDNLGLQIPKTLSDLDVILEKFTTGDPDGDGKDDTFGGQLFSGGLQWSVFGLIMGAHDAYFDMWYNDNGKMNFGIVRDEFKEAIKYTRKHILAGNISTKNFDVTSGNQIQALSFADEVGVTNYAYQIMADTSPDYQKLKELTGGKANFVAFEPLTGPNGKQGVINATSPRSDNRLYFNSKIKNPERLMEVINWIMSEEGAGYVQYGLEGKQYDVVDGYVKMKEPYNDSINLYKEGFDEQFMLFGMRTLWGTHLGQPSLDGAEIIKKHLVKYPVYNVDIPEYGDNGPNYNQYAIQFISDALTKKDINLDAAFETLKTKMMEAGLDKVTAGANKIAN